MQTLVIRDIINRFHIAPPQSLPDHSILSGTFQASFFPLLKPKDDTRPPYNAVKKIKTRKNLKKIDPTFLMSEDVSKEVVATIEKINTNLQSQEQINSLWLEIKNLFTAEIEKLPNLPNVHDKKAKKVFRKCQPFWNSELESLWFSVSQAEKNFLNFRVFESIDIHQKRALRQTFKEAQKLFDKKFRFYKRKYRNKEMAEQDPKSLWKKLKALHMKPSKNVLEIIKEDRSLSCEVGEVLQRWCTDISKLYAGLHEDPDIDIREKESF